MSQHPFSDLLRKHGRALKRRALRDVGHRLRALRWALRICRDDPGEPWWTPLRRRKTLAQRPIWIACVSHHPADPVCGSDRYHVGKTGLSAQPTDQHWERDHDADCCLSRADFEAITGFRLKPGEVARVRISVRRVK